MQTTAPLISVIVPVYNTEKYLRRCVDSILAQTLPDFELLLIDDGSKDSSGAICDEYAAMDTRIMVFHKPNGGVSSARNMGLDNARGQYITFVDSDDWLESSMLASMMSCVAEGSGTVVCGTQLLSGHKGVGFNFRKDETFPSIEEYLDHYDIRYSTWGMLLEREHIEREHIRFNTELIMAEDREFNMRYFMGYGGRTHCVSKKLYVYCDMNQGSACNRIDVAILLSLLKSGVLMSQIPAKGNVAVYIQKLCERNAKHFLHSISFLYYPPSPFTREEYIERNIGTLQAAYAEAFDCIVRPHRLRLVFARHHFGCYVQYRMIKQKLSELLSGKVTKQCCE